MSKPKDWTHWNQAELFDGDYSLWLATLSRQGRKGQPKMCWEDLGAYTRGAYQLSESLGLKYRKLRADKQVPETRPYETTAEGFYETAVERHRIQVGARVPTFATPWNRLSAFSQFLYTVLSNRVAREAGYTVRAPVARDGDGLDETLDNEPEPDGLDFLDAEDGLGDGLDDGLDDGLGDGLDELATVEEDGL